MDIKEDVDIVELYHGQIKQEPDSIFAEQEHFHRCISKMEHNGMEDSKGDFLSLLTIFNDTGDLKDEDLDVDVMADCDEDDQKLDNLECYMYYSSQAYKRQQM